MWWTYFINVTYIRHSPDAGHPVTGLYFLSVYIQLTSYIFNLHSHLMFVWGLYDIGIHRGMCWDTSGMKCYPSNSQAGCLSNSILNLRTFLFLDKCGYITNITSTKLSSNKNPCFYARIQNADDIYQIKFMVNSTIKQRFFLEKL